MTAVEQFWKDVQDILPSSVDTETGIKLVRAYSQAKEMERLEKVEFALTAYNKKFSTDKSFVELVAEMSNLSPWIKVCVEVDRSGIVEENLVRHYEFNVEPTREEILALLNAEDIGYDDEYCSFTFYKV